MKRNGEGSETNPKKKHTVKNRIGKALSAFSVFLVLVMIVLCIPLSVPGLFGYSIYRVISGSMAPEIPQDSIVYAKETDPAALAGGDIIVFYANDAVDTVTTHRVVSNDTENQKISTKGDANNGADLYEVDYDNVVGKVDFHIPLLGRLAGLLSETKGKLAAAGVLLAAILLRVLGGILQR